MIWKREENPYKVLQSRLTLAELAQSLVWLVRQVFWRCLRSVRIKGRQRTVAWLLYLKTNPPQRTIHLFVIKRVICGTKRGQKGNTYTRITQCFCSLHASLLFFLSHHRPEVTRCEGATNFRTCDVEAFRCTQKHITVIHVLWKLSCHNLKKRKKKNWTRSQYLKSKNTFLFCSSNSVSKSLFRVQSFLKWGRESQWKH